MPLTVKRTRRYRGNERIALHRVKKLYLRFLDYYSKYGPDDATDPPRQALPTALITALGDASNLCTTALEAKWPPEVGGGGGPGGGGGGGGG